MSGREAERGLTYLQWKAICIRIRLVFQGEKVTRQMKITVEWSVRVHMQYQASPITSFPNQNLKWTKVTMTYDYLTINEPYNAKGPVCISWGLDHWLGKMWEALYMCPHVMTWDENVLAFCSALATNSSWFPQIIVMNSQACTSRLEELITPTNNTNESCSVMSH